MMKTALNAVCRIHSRVGTLKRLGAVDIFSPCRLTPSNYFRFLRGPEYTTIKGVEYVIPVDTMLGQYSQLLSFSLVPDAGAFKIVLGSFTTTDIAFNATASDIETALRLHPPLINVVVTGNFTLGFSIVFTGFSVAPALGSVADLLLTNSSNPVSCTFKNTYEVWADLIKKGDRIIDGNKQWTVDEIIEIHNLGASVMAYRCRAD